MANTYINFISIVCNQNQQFKNKRNGIKCIQRWVKCIQRWVKHNFLDVP